MPVDLETEAMGVIIDELKNNHSLDAIAQKMTADFNKLYGPEWLCFIGKDSIGSHFLPAPKSQLWFSYNTVNFILFKSLHCSNNSANGLRESEAVKSARNDKTFTEIFTKATDQVKTGVFKLVREAVDKEEDFGEVQTYLKRELSQKVGGVWLTIITVKTDYSTNWDINFSIDSALEFELGDMRFYLYQQNHK